MAFSQSNDPPQNSYLNISKNLTYILLILSTIPCFFLLRNLHSPPNLFFFSHNSPMVFHTPPPSFSLFLIKSQPTLLLPFLFSSSSSETPPFQPSFSLAIPLLPIQQKSLSQPPPWQGGHVLATRPMQPLTLGSHLPLLKMKCSTHSKRPNSSCPKRVIQVK